MLENVLPGSFNQYFYLFVECISISSVNAFIIISSIYLSKTQDRKISKIVYILLETILVDLIYYICFIIKNKSFSIQDFVITILPCNYYVILYLVLYILSPYMNILFDSLDKNRRKNFLILIIIIFSICSYTIDFVERVFNISLAGLNPVGLYGSQEGYNIVNFILLYFIGTYLSSMDILPSIKRSLMLLPICIGLLFILAFLSTRNINIPVWNYNNPLIIISSVLLVSIFLNIKIKNIYINYISKPVFTFFLTHCYFFPYIQRDIIANNPIYVVIFVEILLYIIIYFISFVFDVIYRRLFSIVFNK